MIVGRDGAVRRRIESLTNCKIEVGSDGLVTISAGSNQDGAVMAWKARDIIQAMARGFSPKGAFALIDDDSYLVVISLRDLVGSSPNQIRRVAGRIIGERGRTKRFIESTAEVRLSVYGHTVSLIGTYPNLDYASRAVSMLVEGAPHAVVYRYLERMRREMNRERAEIWEPTL